MTDDPTASPFPFLARTRATRDLRQKLLRAKLVAAVRALAATVGGTPTGTQCRKAGIHVGGNNCFGSLAELMKAARLPRRGRGHRVQPRAAFRAAPPPPVPTTPPARTVAPPPPARSLAPPAPPPAAPTTWEMEPQGWMA